MAVFGKFRVRARRHTAALATAALVAGVLASMVSVQPALAAPGDITTVQGGGWGVDWAGGRIYTFGDQAPPVVPDNGPATAGTLLGASKIVVDPAGNLYILAACQVRRVDHATGIITTVAGTGTDCTGGFSANGAYSGEGGLATAATISASDIAIGAAGDLYLTHVGYDAGNYPGRVLKVDHLTGIITTVAGGGTPADGVGDNGPATAAYLDHPAAIALDPAGNIFVGAGGRIRRIDHATGIITTLVLTGVTDVNPLVLTFGGGKLFVYGGISNGGTVLGVDPTSGNAVVVAGGGSPADGVGDGGPAVAAALSGVRGLAYQGGQLYISSFDSVFTGPLNNRVRKVDLGTGIITTAAGTGVAGDRGDGYPAPQAQLNNPQGVALNAAGDLFIVDANNNRVRRVDHTTGIITTVVGGGIGDGGPVGQASLRDVRGVIVDPAGNVFIADCGHSRVRKLAPNGTITTVAGGGTPADHLGDNGPATAAALDCPSGLALVTTGANAGTLYIADAGSNRVRKVGPNGIITTVVGTGTAGYAGDGGPATAAKLNGPTDVAVDATGQLYIADTANNRVRKVNTAGVISTLAGDGIAKFGRDGIKATISHVVKPTGVTLDGHGNLVIAENGFARIRQVNLATGIITTIAGTGIPGYTGDGGPATLAELSAPTKVAFDTAGNMYISDHGNGVIRRVEAGTTPLPTVGCGAVITKTTVLSADIGPCPLDGVIIGADKVTLDLNGHHILGVGHMDDAGGANTAVGIRLTNRIGVTITGARLAGVPQGSVSGFQEGVAIIGGFGNTVTNLNVHDNIGPLSEASTFGDGIGIFFSSKNRILANQIVHNGIYDGIGVLGIGSDQNLIQNNTITNSFGGGGCCGGAGEGSAIILNPFLDVGLPRMVSIYGNQIIGNTISNNDNSGISSISNINGVIKNNVVENNGLPGGGAFGGPLYYPGNGIGVSKLANAAGDTNVLVQGNQVHGNAINGIIVTSSGNRILNNNAAGNGIFFSFLPGFDLADEEAFPCHNVWYGNVWLDRPDPGYGFANGGYENGCETAGGHGVPYSPPPAAAAAAKAPAVKAPSVQAKPAPKNSWSNPAPRGHPANPAG